MLRKPMNTSTSKNIWRFRGSRISLTYKLEDKLIKIRQSWMLATLRTKLCLHLSSKDLLRSLISLKRNYFFSKNLISQVGMVMITIALIISKRLTILELRWKRFLAQRHSKALMEGLKFRIFSTKEPKLVSKKH